MAPKVQIKKASSSTYKVVSQTGRVGRVLFKGLEADARDYVERNFPRAHVEPGVTEVPVHDVKLLSPDGNEEVYHHGVGWSPKPDYAEDRDESEVDSEDEYV